MRLIFSLILLSSILFPIEGIIVFNDQTIIEGDVKSIDNNYVLITPEGLNFPEEILLQSIDSVKINNGMIPVANGNIIFFYKNGEFIDAKEIEKSQLPSTSTLYEDIEYVYELEIFDPDDDEFLYQLFQVLPLIRQLGIVGDCA